MVINLTEKEYRSHPAISRSELWHMRESPEKFIWHKEHPPEPTPAMLFGQVAHKLMFLPEEFDAEFAVMPDINRRTKAGQVEYEQFLADNAGKTIVKADMYEQANAMVDAARRHPLVAQYLTGQAEQPFFWTDDLTGEECKCRTDMLTVIDDFPVVVDYKTTRNASTEAFNNEIFRYGYHFQAAMYTTGVMECMGLTERPDFVFICQEKTAPYSVNVIEVSEGVMLAGLDKYRELLGQYHECKEMGVWYGYNGPFDEPNESFLPGWVQLGVEEEEDTDGAEE